MATAQLYPSALSRLHLPWRWPQHSCIHQLYLDYTTLAMATAQLYPSALSRLHLPWPRHSCIQPVPSRLHYLGDGDGTAVSGQLYLYYTTLAMATAQLYPASSIWTTLPWRWRRHSCIRLAPSRLHYLGDGDGTVVSSQLHLDYTT